MDGDCEGTGVPSTPPWQWLDCILFHKRFHIDRVIIHDSLAPVSFTGAEEETLHATRNGL